MKILHTTTVITTCALQLVKRFGEYFAVWQVL